MSIYTLLALCIAVLCSAMFCLPQTQIHAQEKGKNLLPEPVELTLKMGDLRQDWPHNQWKKYKLTQPVNLSAFDGMEIKVSTDKPRSDAGVFIALEEADGTWRYVSWAVDLTQKENTGVFRFDDMALPLYSFPGNWRDENDHLDTDKIVGYAIGMINPMGVGDVSFTVESMTPVKSLGDDSAREKPLKIKVGGSWLKVNDHEMIPRGLFGSFNLTKGHTAKYRLSVDRRIHFNPVKNGAQYGDAVTNIMVNTIGDRVQPSIRLIDKNWKSKLETLGKAYGESSKAKAKQGVVTYVEWWNEPYLNWSNDNRASFIPRLYDQSKAKEGGPVHIKLDGEVAPHLKWTKDREKARANSHWWLKKYERMHGRDKDHWMRGKDAKGKVYSVIGKPYHAGRPNGHYGGKWEPHTHPPKGTKEGQTYTIGKGKKQKTLTAFTPWYVYDETQHTYRSGMGMVKMYNEPMMAFGRAAKKADPNLFFIAGWGTRPSEDNWSSWDLYKATIDEGIELIDGVGDHDYGGSPTRLAANYEVVTAYGKTKHNKWLYGVNTETASSTDPQAYANATASPVLGKFKWTAAKMLYNLEMVPDKAKIFMWFGMNGGFWSDTGEGVFFEMAKKLRGKMVQVEKPVGGYNDKVLVVASVDGTDPKSPRPADLGHGVEMVVAIYNMDSVAREIDAEISGPSPLSIKDGEMHYSYVDGKGMPQFKTDKLNVKPKASGTEYHLKRKLEPGQLVVLIFKTTIVGKKGQKFSLRDQYFLDQVLVKVTPDKAVKTTVKADAASLKNAKRAWVQMVAEHLGHGEATMIINGKSYELPAMMSPANTPLMVRIPIDVADLKAENSIEIKVKDKAAGFLLCSAGIYIERLESNGM